LRCLAQHYRVSLTNGYHGPGPHSIPHHDNAAAPVAAVAITTTTATTAAKACGRASSSYRKPTVPRVCAAGTGDAIDAIYRGGTFPAAAAAAIDTRHTRDKGFIPLAAIPTGGIAPIHASRRRAATTARALRNLKRIVSYTIPTCKSLPARTGSPVSRSCHRLGTAATP
jgi:hypothetical protein